MVGPGSCKEDYKFYSEEAIKQQKSGAGNKGVETVYNGVVADNIEYNMKL